MQIAFALQGGLGLPTPDYYTKAEYKDLRDAYVEHIGQAVRAGRRAGRPGAASRPSTVLAFETRLARHSLSRVELRKPENQYHFVSVAEANKVTPHFDWAAFFKAQGVDLGKGFSLSQPKFFAELRQDAGRRAARRVEGLPGVPRHRRRRALPVRSRSRRSTSPSTARPCSGQPEQQSALEARAGHRRTARMGMALGQLYVAQLLPARGQGAGWRSWSTTCATRSRRASRTWTG